MSILINFTFLRWLLSWHLQVLHLHGLDRLHSLQLARTGMFTILALAWCHVAAIGLLLVTPHYHAIRHFAVCRMAIEQLFIFHP